MNEPGTSECKCHEDKGTGPISFTDVSQAPGQVPYT